MCQGEVTAITANVIATYPKGNEYLLQDSLANYQKDEKVIYQKISEDVPISWEGLSNLKGSHPMQTTEFAPA